MVYLVDIHIVQNNYILQVYTHTHTKLLYGLYEQKKKILTASAADTGTLSRALALHIDA